MSRYAKPEFPIAEVNKAAKTFFHLDGSVLALSGALHVIENWRSAHAYPAQAFYVTLKRRATGIDHMAVAAQRIKRLPSIWAKLKREKDMKLSQMQDIGGCRAVLPFVEQVRELQETLNKSWKKHEALSPKDYIANPKNSGYRGVHLKYRYHGTGEKSVYNGLKIEIQIRSVLQHRWATAVEGADTFTQQALKASHGPAEWKRFFALMASVYALREGTPLVPNTPATFRELQAELNDLDDRHHFQEKFYRFAHVLQTVEDEKNAAYFLVTLNPIMETVNVRGFKRNESQEANAEYTKAEQAAQGTSLNIVLVSVESIAALKKVYPNYFLDTIEFSTDVLKTMTGSLI